MSKMNHRYTVSQVTYSCWCAHGVGFGGFN